MGLFGILVAQAIFFPERTLYAYFFFPMKMKQAAMALSMVEIYLTLAGQRSEVAHAAHLFGAIAAWMCLKAMETKATVHSRTPVRFLGAHRGPPRDVPDEL